MKFFTVFAAIVTVAVARHTTSTWTLVELSEALQNPYTDPDALPILEQALNELMIALFAGQDMQSIQVPLPSHVSIDRPVAPTPVTVNPVPIAPAPATPASSPIVQLIINVNGQQQVAEIAPTPVTGEIAAVIPTAVQFVDTSAVVTDPTPVVVAPLPAPEFNPIDIIAVNPVVVAPIPAVNPLDIIAVNPV